MANLRLWKNVPKKSQLEISVTDENGTADGPYVAELRLVDDDGDEVKRTDSQLRPGPARIELDADTEYYDGRIWVRFVGKGTAIVTTQMFKPDGTTPHGSKVAFELKGTKNARLRATLIAYVA
jgi:hypothetical protein